MSKRVTVAALFAVAGARHGAADRAPHDELAAENAHRLHHRLADHRLAGARQQAAQHLPPWRSVIGGDQMAGEHQRPGGCIDEHRARLAQMRIPSGAADLVPDQAVHRGPVGHAQQRLGQTHQDDAFLAGQAIFADEGVNAAGPGAAAAHLRDQLAGLRLDARQCRWCNRRLEQSRLHANRLVGAIGDGDSVAQRRTLGQRMRNQHGSAPARPICARGRRFYHNRAVRRHRGLSATRPKTMALAQPLASDCVCRVRP